MLMVTHVTYLSIELVILIRFVLRFYSFCTTARKSEDLFHSFIFHEFILREFIFRAPALLYGSCLVCYKRFNDTYRACKCPRVFCERYLSFRGRKMRLCCISIELLWHN